MLKHPEGHNHVLKHHNSFEKKRYVEATTYRNKNRNLRWSHSQSRRVTKAKTYLRQPFQETVKPYPYDAYNNNPNTKKIPTYPMSHSCLNTNGDESFHDVQITAPTSLLDQLSRCQRELQRESLVANNTFTFEEKAPQDRTYYFEGYSCSCVHERELSTQRNNSIVFNNTESDCLSD